MYPGLPVSHDLKWVESFRQVYPCRKTNAFICTRTAVSSFTSALKSSETTASANQKASETEPYLLVQPLLSLRVIVRRELCGLRYLSRSRHLLVTRRRIECCLVRCCGVASYCGEKNSITVGTVQFLCMASFPFLFLPYSTCIPNRIDDMQRYYNSKMESNQWWKCEDIIPKLI
jgi:hypothetical protein